MKRAKFIAISTVIAGFVMASNPALSSPEISAEWCLDRATNQIKDQSMRKNNGNCRRWVKEYGFRSQNELAKEAVSFAKGGDNARAIERIMICQCHNGQAQSEIQGNKDALINYLKTR